jgi:hypothetical protein
MNVMPTITLRKVMLNITLTLLFISTSFPRPTDFWQEKVLQSHVN